MGNILPSLFTVLFAAMLPRPQAAPPAAPQSAQASIGAVLAQLAPNKQLPNDLTIMGQMTDPSGTVLSFQITTKGTDQAIYQIGTGATMVSTTIAKGSGWTVAGGKITILHPHTAQQRPTLVPFLDLLDQADAPSLQITDKGTSQLGSALAHVYSLKLPDPAPETRIINIPLDEEADFYVDPASSLVVRSTRFRMAENDMNLRLQFITDFSDYRIVQGFLIPFRVVETANFTNRKPAQSVYVVQTVTVNSGVLDSAFLMPGAKQ